MIHFDWPWIFLLLPLPWLLRFLLPVVREPQAAILQLPPGTGLQLPYTTTPINRRRSWLLLAGAGLAWTLLLGAASRPQWLGEPLTLPVSGRDLLMAVDLSGSMAITDFELRGQLVSRLTAVKQVAGDFIRRRTGDRLGLILFGRNAYLQAPLTFDHQTVQTLLDEAVIGLAGKETAIGDAIGLAIKKLFPSSLDQLPPSSQENSPQPLASGQHATNRTESDGRGSPVLIVLTDGANTAGHIAPLQAAQLAAAKNLRIHTIGIGADVVLDRQDASRPVNTTQDANDLDEKTLTDIAERTGGRYFRARDSVSLEQIYQLLDQLEPIQGTPIRFRPTQALFFWPLGFGLLVGYVVAWRATSHLVDQKQWLVTASDQDAP